MSPWKLIKIEILPHSLWDDCAVGVMKMSRQLIDVVGGPPGNVPSPVLKTSGVTEDPYIDFHRLVL